MASNSNKFVRLNLAKDHCTSLSLVTFLPKADLSFQQFENLLDESGNFYSASLYRRGSVDHIIWITLDGEGDPTDQLYIQIEFEVPSDPVPGGPPKSMQLEEEVVEKFAQLSESLIWHCRVIFEYDDDLSIYETVFPLPIPLDTTSGSLPFDEIRGIRGVKRSESDPTRNEYTFTLDRPGTMGVRLNLDFFQSLMPSVLTPASVYAVAARIAKQLVFQRPRE